MNKLHKQRGAVSLFVVIFAALLITVVTVSFIRIMIQNQQQATANDLSQSAYDSAQAGVEDAKRAILLLQSTCATGTAGDCAAMEAKINSPTCNEAISELTDVNITNNEVKVEVNGDKNNLDQAYTCVKVSMLTNTYVNYLKQDASEIVPLVGTSDFDTIKVEWFDSSDSSSSGSTGSDISDIDVPGPGSTPLLSQDNWTNTTHNSRPSVMRAQVIQFNKSAATGFSLTDFDDPNNTNAFNNTLFLYPSTTAGGSTFSDDSRLSAKSFVAPSPKKCVSNLNTNIYACSATLKLQKTVGSDYAAYLNLKSFYRGSHYRITLYDSNRPVAGEPGTLVQFDGVQPNVDSTGRANDLFRRVQSKISLKNDNFPFPQGEIDITGNLCKTFFVTNDPGDFKPGSCDPSR
ncbi:MAG: hypothetical protein NTV39_03915 [Candidatus Saccharibacteria bacterium]|nr:hypothetical protein [Candidatus Saccharibacteria bacterium]